MRASLANIAVASALGLLVAPAAHAGGLSLLGMGGTHTDEVYFYSNVDSDTFDDDDPVIYDDYKDYEQYSIQETLPHFGGGLELVLGDRDDLITGSVRVHYLQDAPQVDPGSLTSRVPSEFVVSAYREDPRHIGVGLIGLNWGLFEVASDRLRIMAVGHVGSGFITTDHTEFLMASAGPGVVYKASRQFHAFGEFAYQARFQQRGWQHAGNMTLGLRYYFD